MKKKNEVKCVLNTFNVFDVIILLWKCQQKTLI